MSFPQKQNRDKRKLNDNEVRAIRLIAHLIPQYQLSEMFKLDRSQVSKIIRRKAYVNVEDE